MFHKSRKSLEESLIERGLVQGEFLLRSGVMSSEKFDFERITQSAKWRDRLLLRRTESALGALILDKLPNCEIVLTVADGANPLATGVARYVSRGQEHPSELVLGHETQKCENGAFRVKQGNIYVYDRKAVIVDDVFTAGTNIGLVADTVERFGGEVIGAAVVLNRNEHGDCIVSRGGAAPGIPVYSLIQRPIPTRPVSRL